MNIILFENHELGKPLSRRDERTIHLVKILHKKPGDTFEAGVLDGHKGTGRIESLRLDGSLTFSLELPELPPPRLSLRLAVGFPRPIQLRRILRDLSNLGLLAVDLLGTELGEKSYRDTKLLSDGGARAALIEGAVQARDTRLPELSVYPRLDTWLMERPWDKTFTSAPQSIPPAPLLIAADNVRPEGSMSHLSALGRPLVMAVGSERGWSDAERDALEKAGFLRLSLGDRCLRTETACLAAAVLAMEKIGALS
ncbi:ribosomal RNA small subunit methyltransferase E [Spirochaetia bacterium]|nr:ribosomal RNA small subunit methyltransferase E [Spirochaetia bacterium]